jgi:hypothetical protein
MSKNIIMQVLTSTGYEPMYPFNPRQILNGTYLATSTNTQYNITITGIPVPLTNSFGNDMGIISFFPGVNNMDNITLSINGDTARPILMADGTTVRANTLVAGRNVLVRYYNNNFYLILDKNQIGLGNVENTAPADMPVSTAVTTALNGKLNTPTLVPRNANLNTYTTPGLYYNNSTTDAATITNTPAQVPFSLFIEQHAGVKQTFTNYSTSGIQTWVRNYSNNAWGSWVQQAFILSGTNTPDPTIGMNGNIYLKINS